jgi:hypothetical protein
VALTSLTIVDDQLSTIATICGSGIGIPACPSDCHITPPNFDLTVGLSAGDDLTEEQYCKLSDGKYTLRALGTIDAPGPKTEFVAFDLQMPIEAVGDKPVFRDTSCPVIDAWGVAGLSTALLVTGAVLLRLRRVQALSRLNSSVSSGTSVNRSATQP